MKKLLTLSFFVILLLAGCGSSKKQLEKGNYDASIELAVKKLLKNPGDSKQADVLTRAYTVANDKDNERIRLLKTEGRPDSWDEIYQIYTRLSNRQSLVRTVTPLNTNGKKLDFPYVDYVTDLVNAKKSAAEFYYNDAMELMKNNSKESFRQAYSELVRAKQYAGTYEGIDGKISEARFLGTSRVLVSIKNNTQLNFPPEFIRDLLPANIALFNSEWVEYYSIISDKNSTVDYLINVNLKNVAVGPDQTSQRDSLIKREVEDGFSYVLDKKGNVVKDSLGNDLKTKKYKTLQCALVESYQSKSCRIDGDVEVVKISTGASMNREPLGAQSVFEHVSSRAIGDLKALNENQLARTKSTPVPFPDDMEMIMRCSENLKKGIRGALQNNRKFVF